MGKFSLDAFAIANAYRIHRVRVKSMTSCIDLRPPVRTTHLASYRYDGQTISKRLMENMDLLVNLHEISHIKSGVQCHNRLNRRSSSSMHRSCEELAFIEKRNRQLACKILSVKPTVKKVKPIKYKEWIKKPVPPKKEYTVPFEIMEHYECVFPAAEDKMLHTLLRPKIFFDIDVENYHPLGRITVQLFVEACPEVVLHFIRMCTYNKFDMFNVIRIFPILWVEAELSIENGSPLNGCDYEHYMYAMDHGASAGVLSFSKAYLEGFPEGIINFTISFKPIPLLNGERIPFGLITRGLRLLDCLQDFGTKNGITQKNVKVVNCGVEYSVRN